MRVHVCGLTFDCLRNGWIYKHRKQAVSVFFFFTAMTWSNRGAFWISQHNPIIPSPALGIMAERFPLAEKALSDGFARLRYKDASLLIWQQQQLELEKTPINYLNRSRSAWYSQYGNQAVVVRDKTTIHEPEHGSRTCSVMWQCYGIITAVICKQVRRVRIAVSDTVVVIDGCI